MFFPPINLIKKNLPVAWIFGLEIRSLSHTVFQYKCLITSVWNENNINIWRKKQYLYNLEGEEVLSKDDTKSKTISKKNQ